MISIRQIIKEMLGQRTRLFLTILAIAWGTASISLMLAVGEGMRMNFGRTVSGAGKNLLVVSGGYVSMSYQGAFKEIVQLTKQDLLSIKDLQRDVKTVFGEYTFQSTIHRDNETTWVSPAAVDPEFFDLRNIEVMPGGRAINLLDVRERRQVIVLGSSIAKTLFESNVNEKKKKHASFFADVSLTPAQAKQIVGKQVKLDNHIFTVIGISTPKMQMANYGAPDDYSVWIPSSTYELLSQKIYYSNLLVLPNDPKNNDELKKSIRKVIAKNHGVNPEDEQILQFWDAYDIAQKTNTFFLGLQIFLGIIGCITLIVAGIGIANVMYVSVRKATREIGIRMALGAKTYHILTHYIFEALLAAFVGGIIGLLISLGVVHGINTLSTQTRAAQFIGNFKPILSLRVLLTVGLALGAVGFIAALFPALSAANTDPAEALQHE